MAITRLVTVEELEQMPDDGYRYELLRGVLKKMPPTGAPHGIVRRNLAFALDVFLEEHGLGVAISEVGFIFEVDPDTMYGPDVALIPAEHLPVSVQTVFERLVPPLVAEVLSPSNRRLEIEEKVRVYLQAGVRLVWIIDPIQRTIRVRTPDGSDHVLTVADELTGGDVLPGFRLPVTRVFKWLI